MRIVKEVQRPEIENHKNYKIVKKGSYFLLDFIFECNAYKHIVLTQESSMYEKDPVKTTRSLKLISLEEMMEKNAKYAAILQGIFYKNILFTHCNNDTLEKIKKKILNSGYDGLINFQGDVLIYAEYFETEGGVELRFIELE